MTKKQKQNLIDTAIKRIKKEFGLKVHDDSDAELASKLNVEPKLISEWKQKGNIDFFLIKECLPKTNIDWVLSDWRYDGNGSYSIWSIDELLRIADSVARHKEIKINMTFEKTLK